jgi:hypothetical protein
VVSANSELQKRGLLKHARIAKSVAAALRERGADDLTARLAAEMGMLAFTVAFGRWMESGDDEPFLPVAAATLSDLQERAAELDSRCRASVDAGSDRLRAEEISGKVAQIGKDKRRRCQ